MARQSRQVRAAIKAEHRARELHESVLDQKSQRHTAAARAAAWALSLLVYASTLVFLPLAVWCLVVFPIRVVGVGLALVLLWMLWRLRPRSPVTPAEGRLDADEAPSLRALLDRVSLAVGTAPPVTLVLDPSINAAVYVGRWREGRVLRLGVPLWLALSPQARVALVAHELGHFASGDTRRSWWVSGAIRVLESWNRVLAPGGADGGGMDFFDLIVHGFLWLIWLVPRALGSALMHVTMLDSRAAEYRADGIAAALAGRSGALEVLELLGRQAGLEAALQRASLTPGGDVIAAAAAHRPLGPAPEHSDEILHAFDSHPPVRLRLEAVQRGPDPTPAVVMDAAESREIDAELEPKIRVVERRIRDLYR